MVIYENKLSAEDFCFLQQSVGFGRPDLKQTEIALENSIYIVSVECDGWTVGMGRLVGDGARNFYLQDIFVHPDYQGQKVGTAIVKKLLAYIENLELEGCNIMVGLMAAKGKEDFYKKFNFRVRANEHEGSGMMLNIEK